MDFQNQNLEGLGEPEDYFQGRGRNLSLPTPTNVLVFLRRDRARLQQQALQNRSHHRWVLMFNLGTRGRVHVDHRTHTLRPGQGLLVLPYQFHHFTHLDAHELRWLFCTFDLGSAPLLDPLRHQVFSMEEQARWLLARLLEEWNGARGGDDPRPAREALLQSLLLTLLMELRFSLESVAPPVPTPPGNRLLERVNRLLDARTRRPGSCAELAERLGISESGLRVKFRQTAGVPIGHYLRNTRINRAMALLRTTELAVSEVGAEAGFSSPQAFSRAFRQATGRSPRDYREGGPAVREG